MTEDYLRETLEKVLERMETLTDDVQEIIYKLDTLNGDYSEEDE